MEPVSQMKIRLPVRLSWNTSMPYFLALSNSFTPPFRAFRAIALFQVTPLASGNFAGFGAVATCPVSVM